MDTSPAIQRLVSNLKKLPGIGEKSATRLAFFLLGAPATLVQELAEALARVQQDTVLCEQCFNLTDHSPCAICRDERRDAKLICVPPQEPRFRDVFDVGDLPQNLVVTARSSAGDIMALRHRDRPHLGVQFHPESFMTTEGPSLIRNFLASP